MSEIKIVELEFNKSQLDIIDENAEYIKNYPTDYIIYNDNTAYIGETVRIKTRLKEHLQHPERRKLKKVVIMGHEKFNQSATNNIESNLINYFIADRRFEIQNTSKVRTNIVHNYYTRNEYDKGIFIEIWESLRRMGIARESIEVLSNRDVFKLSPYKELSEEQLELKYDIIKFCEDNANEKNMHSVLFVEGEAGSGKSVLLSSTFNTLLNEAKNESSVLSGVNNNYLLVNHAEMIKTYKEIAKSIPDFKGKNILKPTTFVNDCIKGKIKSADIVFVDEGHMSLSKSDSYNSFTQNNHIEEIIKHSSVTVVFYDSKQVLKLKSYWNNKMIANIRKDYNGVSFKLNSQFRIKASKEILDWIESFVYSKMLPLPKKEKSYDLRIFGDAGEMHDEIVKRNKECKGLCRVVSTFDYLHKKDGQTYYVEEPNFKFPWNMNYHTSWAETDQSINEVGSIYTVLGFDLNYVGVILGPSVQYDEVKNCLRIDTKLYCDTEAFRGRDDIGDIEIAKKRIIQNSINVLVKRGVKGLYIYASNPRLREKLLELQNERPEI